MRSGAYKYVKLKAVGAIVRVLLYEPARRVLLYEPCPATLHLYLQQCEHPQLFFQLLLA